MVPSIFAVTGLAGHAFGSWKSRKSGKMWLRDLMPSDLPTARVFTYGYDTKLAGSKSNARISDYAKQFLHTVADARRCDPQRPIIFIGHSLGGLVIKEVRMIVVQTLFKDTCIRGGRRLSRCCRLLSMLTSISWCLAMAFCFLEFRIAVWKTVT